MPYYLVPTNVQDRADVISAMCPGFPSIEDLDAHHLPQGWYSREDSPTFRYHGEGMQIRVASIKRIGDYNPLTKQHDKE